MNGFLNSRAAGYVVAGLVVLVILYFIWKKFSKLGDAAAKVGGVVAGGAKAVSDVSYQGATNIGQTVLGKTFTLADLFPTSEAEKRFNDMMAKK